MIVPYSSELSEDLAMLMTGLDRTWRQNFALKHQLVTWMKNQIGMSDAARHRCLADEAVGGRL